MVNKIGLKDQPITKREHDALKIVDYADVLSKFIEECDTPMTVALQGDWGTGKTSLMHLIEECLWEKNSQENVPFLTVWFNTWQYSQFNQSDSLALSMMLNITEALYEETDFQDKSLKKRVTQCLKQFANAAFAAGASATGQFDNFNVFKKAFKESGDSAEASTDEAFTLTQVKKDLKTLVKKATSKIGAKKLVVFVDDLDRLQPKVAVELLEAMKVFLDIEKCVYVLACDYSIVTTGLKVKFGDKVDEEKGKSFFDKIIQVPFKMPIRRYDASEYIERMLKEINLKYVKKEDIKNIYSNLVKYSVGFNPRTIKRILNSLQLLLILDDKRKESDSQSSEPANKTKVLFGILCMQEAYEPIYEYIAKNLNNADGIMRLSEGLKSGDEFSEKIENNRLQDASKFCEAFIKCIQLDQDLKLSDDEMEHLKEMMSYSTLVNVTEQPQSEFDEDEFALYMRRLLNEEYERILNWSKPKFSKFRLAGNKAFLNLPPNVLQNSKLIFRGDRFSYRFGVGSASNHKVLEFGQIICKEFGWNDDWERVSKDESCDDDKFSFWFYECRHESEASLDLFENEVLKRCDDLFSMQNVWYKWSRQIKQVRED